MLRAIIEGVGALSAFVGAIYKVVKWIVKVKTKT